MTKEVALVGFAPTKKLAEALPDSVPIWSLNNAFAKGIKRIDALFDPHYIEHIKHPSYTRDGREDHKRIDWLRANTTIPVYMLKEYPEIPMSRAYPMDEVVTWKGNKNNLSSTFALMMAFALMHDYRRIHVYGFHMGAEYEYMHQLPDGMYWIGRAEGMGVEVIGPKESHMFRQRKVYGYEGTAMITRRTLEKHRDSYQKQFEANDTELKRWQGVLTERTKGFINQKTGRIMGNHKPITEAQKYVRQYEAQRFACECTVAALQKLVDEADLIEVEPMEIAVSKPPGGTKDET